MRHLYGLFLVGPPKHWVCINPFITGILQIKFCKILFISHLWNVNNDIICGGVLPYLGMVVGSEVMISVFEIFVPIVYLNSIRLTPSFCRNISFSLSHLVPEILGPKIGHIFHKNVLFNNLEAFCFNFLLDFLSS